MIGYSLATSIWEGAISEFTNMSQIIQVIEIGNKKTMMMPYWFIVN